MPPAYSTPAPALEEEPGDKVLFILVALGSKVPLQAESFAGKPYWPPSGP